MFRHYGEQTRADLGKIEERAGDTMDNLSNTFERVIIVDQPSEEDGFEGKGHLRTATQLADAIEEFQNEDRSIGLEGDWGSGKSTVVGLAGKHLKKTERDQFHFFTFDLWSTQTSPFRRTFLEKLIEWGKKEFSGQKSLEIELEEQRDRVRDRTVTTKSKSFRELDWFGMIFILFAPIEGLKPLTRQTVLRIKEDPAKAEAILNRWGISN